MLHLSLFDVTCVCLAVLVQETHFQYKGCITPNRVVWLQYTKVKYFCAGCKLWFCNHVNQKCWLALMKHGLVLFFTGDYLFAGHH